MWTAARQAPLSMGFSRREHWSGLPVPPAGDLPDPGIERSSLLPPTLTGRILFCVFFLPLAPPGKPIHLLGGSIKGLKMLLCASLAVEPESYPKAAQLALGCYSQVSAYPLSLISSYLNLPFGTDGRSWQLESIPYKQGTGNRERLLP